VWLGQFPGVGVTEVDDVAEHLIKGPVISVFPGGPGIGQTFQFGEKRL